LIVGNRSLIIVDEEIRRRVDCSKVSFNLIRDNGGEVLIVALIDKNGVESFNGRKSLRFNLPKQLKEHVGETIEVYTERVRPLSGEAFRVRPVSFVIGNGRKSKDTPYLTTGSIVIPQMYYNNNYSKDFCVGLTVSFNDTTIDTINNGYIIACLNDSSTGKSFIDEYRLKQCKAGLRTNTMSYTKRLLDRSNKKLEHYIYEGTMEGKLFFKE
jgi:hypothetical protein